MKLVKEIGLKITPAQREYYRYTGASAELERRGAGSSRPELAWTRRLQEQRQSAGEAGPRADAGVEET
jgi:hypothetical protein